jgi:hypothetical protein
VLVFGNISLDPSSFADITKEEFKSMFASKMYGYNWETAYEELQGVINKKPPPINNTKFKKKSSY